jgi:hypothetical protein
MPTYLVTAPDGRKLKLTGDTPPTEQELDEVFASLPPMEQKGFLGASLETAKNIAQTGGAQVAGGYAGLFELAKTQDPSKAAQAVESVSSRLSPQNVSERSQAQMQDVGQFVENYVNPAVRLPVSGLVGLGELATGQGLDQAAQSVQNVQQQGYGETVGQRVLEETGSPELATAAYASGDLIPFAAGGKALSKGVEAATQAAKSGASGVQQAGRLVSDIVETMPARAENIKTAEIRKGIQEGSKYFIDKKIDPKTGRIIDNPLVSKARKQEISDETIAQTIRLDEGTRRQAQRILDRGANILEYGEKGGGRPNAIIGERVMNRFDTVLDANRKAGKDIQKAVEGMKTQTFDIPDVVDSWEDSLRSLNVNRIDGKLNFKGSDIELNPSTVKVIKTIDNRLKTNYKAQDLHKEKQFIANAIYDAKADVNVPFSDAGEKALDKLRDGFNQKLREASPDYALANDKFSETVTTLNDFKKVMGQKKFNPYSDRIDDTIGIESRKLLTNYRSGQDMQEAIQNLNDMAAKYGGKYDDDVVELARFYDTMEREFKTFASGSFRADTRDAIKDAGMVAFDAATGAPIQAAKGAIKTGINIFKKPVNERAKIKALKDLLKE